MQVENTPHAGLSDIDKAVQALKDSREEQPQPETATEETETETEVLTDEITEEDIPEEVQGEHIPDEVDEDSEAEDVEEVQDDVGGEDLYEVEGETFTLSELQEWKKSGLRQSDYTRKSQEISRDREQLVADRDAFQAEREQMQSHLQQQQARLQDALATFAIEQVETPVRSNFKTTDEYLFAQENYQKAERQKAQAREAYQALQAEQTQAVQQREIGRTLQFFPDWGTDDAYNGAVERMASAASEFGYSRDEVIHGGLMDHRTFRVLNELASLREQLGERKARQQAAAKKVVKSTKRLNSAGKNSETATQVEARKARQKLAKTGTVNDAVAALRARRKG